MTAPSRLALTFATRTDAAMDFSLSPDQQRWHDAAAEFAREELVPDLDLQRRDEAREFWREGWNRCARFGFQGLPIPAEYGGQGQDLPTTISAMEGFGYACPDNGLILAINAALWTVTLPILHFGTPAQKDRWLRGLCDGTWIGANGVSEHQAGSDIFSMTSLAIKGGDGSWLLNGRKTWITAGPAADVFVCYASTDPSKGVMGISAFIVPKETLGFRVVREIPKMGIRTVPMGEIAFEDCRLPADALLGRPGRGAEIFRRSMEWERGAILSAALGSMRRQLESCVAHARSRQQFGQPVGKFQAVSHRLVEMKLRLETARLIVHKLGWHFARNDDVTLASALAKLHVSECYVQNSLDAIQIFGASGFVTETGIERELRDSVGSLIYSGTNDIQKNIIARELGL